MNELLSGFEPLVDTETAAKYLGFSAQTVRRMAEVGKIPCVPFTLTGKRTVYKFRLSDLEKNTQSRTLGDNGVLNGKGIVPARFAPA